MFKQIAFTVVLVAAFATVTNAQSPNDFASSRVRNSRSPLRLNEKQLQMVRDSLRHKSGFVELGFDQQGVLMLGNREHVVGGSATARVLLVQAVDSTNLYELESHESSPEIAFARIDEGEDRKVGETGQRLTIYRVQLDFADFERLSGAREAKAAFEIGLALLHELAHGVLKLQDPRGDMNQIGECDAHVNQMRRELRLPERLLYHPNMSVVQPRDGKRIVSASLTFVARAEANAQPSATCLLNWQPSQVSPNARNIAGLQHGLLMAKNR